MVVEVKLTKISPEDRCLEPCLLIECEVSTLSGECIVEIGGLLLAEDGKIVSALIELPEFSSASKEIDHLIASGNYHWNRKVSSGSRKLGKAYFIAPLSPLAIDYIERLREKRPKRDVELKVRFMCKYLLSYISTSHLHEMPLSSLSPQLRSEFERFKIRGNKPPDSLVVYGYDSEFVASRTNMWILSASESEGKFLALQKDESEHTYRISYDDWTYDFLPKLKAYAVMTFEIPLIEETPKVSHLANAIKELKYAEKSLMEGDYAGVIRSIRNVIFNSLTDVKEVEEQGQKEKRRLLKEEIKKAIISKVPEKSRKEYEEVLRVVEEVLRKLSQDHLSKFIHLETDKLISAPLKADAEYLWLSVTNTVRYLSRLLSI